MTTVQYFAYGSNMLRERMSARVPTAIPIAIGLVRDYHLDFAKISVDGSGKGDMVPNRGGEVWGVLYEMDAARQPDLDVHEGAQYGRKEVEVCFASGTRRAVAYLARSERRDPARVPYDWYLALILAGARQNALPEAYIQGLESASFEVDLDEGRGTRQEALRCLAEAGMTQMLEELRSRNVSVTRG